MSSASIPSDQIDELRAQFSDVRFADEGGVPYFLLSNVALPAGCSPSHVDALLCPVPHSGYPSRLFLSSQVTSRESRNWNATARICDRNWHAISWSVPESATLRLLQLVMEHLRAFR